MKTIGALVFPGFELLDLYGPLEMFGLNQDAFKIHIVAETMDAVAATPGPKTQPDEAFGDRDRYDILLISGGMGSRPGMENKALLSWIGEQAERAEIVATVCTGSAMLAGTGALDGRRATSNKLAWKWVTSQGPKVKWVRKARWVEDGKFFTSSGVSAGTDMSLALIEKLIGTEAMETIAKRAEYVRNGDPDNDPFA
jgi:transcriptional regulator GlxA family with amidase domain